MRLEYEAIRYKQTANGNWLVLFGAPAYEVKQWAGIPQKKNFDSVESTGFQRAFKDDRLNSLISFYSDKRNVLQNPLLCAPREIGEHTIFFIPDDGEEQTVLSQKGKLVINYIDYSALPLLELLCKFKSELEKRVPELKDYSIESPLLLKLKESIGVSYTEKDADDILSVGDVAELDNLNVETSHIAELWQEVACRIALLEDNPILQQSDEILGFTKESIISYIMPATIVDGQHRLIGAIKQAEIEFNSEEALFEIEDLLASGVDIDQAKNTVMNRKSRVLPISMIYSEDPAEHVFQFVVVNQKATPINNALLGTIVSTSLSSEELNRVAERLKHADIPLEASHAVSFATRNPDSPFYNLVQTGIAGESANKLPWTVMKSIVLIFKDLRGGKFFSDENRVDYADLWKRRFLNESLIINANNSSDPYTLWSADNGAWRDVFVSFWCCVRDKLANTEDETKNNYWGSTASNLYNKVSLTILAADFFKYLCDSRKPINSKEDVAALVNDWLLGVDLGYFDRNWNLTVKKDTPSIRKQWSKLWLNYRQDPTRLPALSLYGKVN
ncbi:conserved hypothetical protein [Aeromonas veronii]|uniref:DGQHR domain-containing protein n=1 Tax=Aeromonas veronii TaxID=654 RepID=A0A653KUU6_AERVE|nr:hypothetical protein [Aeromonas veronii]VXA83213.1 conserved hypothetical protein [Aeromonas veronii]